MQTPSSQQSLYTQVFECLKTGNGSQAQQLLTQLLEAYADWAPAHSAAAAVAMHNENAIEAEQHMQEAVRLNPHHGEYLFNRIQLLLAQQKIEEAEQACLSLAPPDAISHKDADSCFLFARCLAHSDPAKAKTWLEAALTYHVQPEQWIAFAEKSFAISPVLMKAFLPLEDVNSNPNPAKVSSQQSVWVQIYVYLCLQNKQFELAEPYLKLALRYNPELVALVYKAFFPLWEARAYQRLYHYFQVCEPLITELPIPPHQFYRDWAVCALRVHNTLKFNAYYEKAIQLSPHPLTYAFEKITHFPAIYESEKEIHLLRQQFAYQLNKIENTVDKVLKKGNIPQELNIRYPFGLTYQGLNDKALVSQLGKIAHRLLYGSDAPQYTSYAPAQELPLKVGFISTYFHNHSVMNAYGKGIAEFAQDPNFEVFLLHAGEKRDKQTDWIASQADHFVHEPRVSEAIAQVKAWKLDVLIYTDIGMHPSSYLMALHRLAPIQGVFAGHPVTTGIPNMDYFFITGTKERESSDNYSEKIILLKSGMGQKTYVPKPEHYSRDMFMHATPENHVYFCPMMLIKMHPSFDEALEGILRQDPQAQIYFVDNEQEPEMSQLLSQRFINTMGESLAQRIHFIPWLFKEKFFEAVCAADVILDSFGFGSGTTTFQVLSMHQPMVTLPGNFYRNNITYAYYKRIEMFDTVTDSVEAYVNKAVHLACDRVYRQKLQTELAHKIADYPAKNSAGLTSIKESLLYLAQNYGKLDPEQRTFSF
jgi:predicted O-linked N-acetylglucosamine transferase (SPINDLY family)